MERWRGRSLHTRAGMRGAALALHGVALAIMFGWAITTIGTGKTIYSAPAYSWFVHHWPHSDRPWGLMFLICGMLGSIGLWRRTHACRYFSATILACGHVTIATAIWSANPISTAVLTYLVIAASSVLVILLTLPNDGL